MDWKARSSKLTAQVEEFFDGEPLYDKKKIVLASLRRFAMYSWLLTVEQIKHIEQAAKEGLGNVADWPIVQVDRSCSSRSGVARASSDPVGKLRVKNTDLDCARRSVDALFD